VPADQDIFKLKNDPETYQSIERLWLAGGKSLLWDVYQQLRTFLACSMNRRNFRQYLPTPETNEDFPASSLLSVKTTIQSMCSTAWLQNKPVSLKEKAAAQMLFALWYGSGNVSGCTTATNPPSRQRRARLPASPWPPAGRGDAACPVSFPGCTQASALRAAGRVPWQQCRGFRVRDLIGASVGWCSALENKNIPLELSLCPGIFEVGRCYSLFVPVEGANKKSQWYERMWLQKMGVLGATNKCPLVLWNTALVLLSPLSSHLLKSN